MTSAIRGAGAATDPGDDLSRAVALFLCDVGPTELRVLDTRRGTVSGYFTDPTTLIAAAQAEDGNGGVYVTLNPALTEALARAANLVVPYAKRTTGDKEIAVRRWLLVDLDPVRLSGIPSTEAEHKQALALARSVYAWLIEQGVPKASLIATDSGNGAAILVRVELPNDDASTDLVRRFLAAVDGRHSTTAVKVDCNVFNAARITRLPGTVNCKGSGTAERPHRRARLLHVPDELAICPTEILVAIAALDEPEKPRQARPRSTGATGSPLDLPRWLADHGLTVLREKPWEGWTLYLLEACPFDASHGANGEVHVGQSASGAIAFACKHDSCTGKTWRDVRDLLEPESRERRESYEQRTRTNAKQEMTGDSSDDASGVVFVSAATTKPAPVTWFMEGRLPLGTLSLVVGIPGEGKSTFLVDCAARATCGTLEGDFYGQPIAVAIATAEDALAEVMVPRLIAARANLQLVHFVQVRRDGMTGNLVLTPEALAKVRCLVRQEGVRLLILDPVVALFPGKIDTHRDGAVRQLLAPLAALAEDERLVIAAVMHLNKSQVQEVLARVSGSIGFVGAARSVLLIGHDPADRDGPTRILAHAKCNVGPQAPSRRFTIAEQQFTNEDGVTITTSRLIWGEDAPDISPRDLIATETGEDRSALADAVEFLSELLSSSPNATEVKAIRRKAREHGIADRTLDRAKQKLGVVSRYDGRSESWSWSLPNISTSGARTPTSEFGALAPETTSADGVNTPPHTPLGPESKDAKRKDANHLGALAPGLGSLGRNPRDTAASRGVDDGEADEVTWTD